MPDQRCGTCQYFEALAGMEYGLCNCPLPPLPMAITCDTEPMLETEGEHCRCWQEKQQENTPMNKPTPLERLILKHEGRSTQHGSGTRSEMQREADAACEELRIKTELCEATIRYDKHLAEQNDDGDSFIVLESAAANYHQWLAKQEGGR